MGRERRSKFANDAKSTADLASSLAQKVSKVNGISPDANGNVTISTGGGGTGILTFETLAELQSAHPNGIDVPVWIISENAWYYWSDGTTPTPGDTTAPTLTMTAGAIFDNSMNVTITASETATIFYTLDGSTPTTSSTVYSSPISINATTTVKTMAVDSAGNPSNVYSQTYTKNTATSLVFDDFNRADNATTLGGSWQPISGTWGITANTAYPITNAVDLVAIVEAGTANCKVSVDIPAYHASYAAKVILRYVDMSNYVVLEVRGADMKLAKKVANTVTNIKMFTAPAMGSNVAVSMNGSNYEVFVNGVSQGTATDTAHQTATKHGLGSNFNTSRFDNFKIESV